jgi:hypothetical protein
VPETVVTLTAANIGDPIGLPAGGYLTSIVILDAGNRGPVQNVDAMTGFGGAYKTRYIQLRSDSSPTRDLYCADPATTPLNMNGGGGVPYNLLGNNGGYSYVGQLRLMCCPANATIQVGTSDTPIFRRDHPLARVAMFREPDRPKQLIRR